MSATTAAVDNDVKVIPNEILLQVKALQEIRKSIRKTTFNMKKPPSENGVHKDLKTDKLKKDCQYIKKELWIRKGKSQIYL